MVEFSSVEYTTDTKSSRLTWIPVKRKDERDYVEYRTQRIILEIYDAMQQAMEAGIAYRTRLDPPPAHGWTPPEATLQTVTGQQGHEVNSLDVNEVQRRNTMSERQPKLPFIGAD